ncbi:hypothetical protein XENTR_v10009490 [Xenopus tropicalis]|nr:hypothetical protein XENTR_v10009490 [Xenopus tropicalis]
MPLLAQIQVFCSYMTKITWCVGIFTDAEPSTHNFNTLQTPVHYRIDGVPFLLDMHCRYKISVPLCVAFNKYGIPPSVQSNRHVFYLHYEISFSFKVGGHGYP